ncbi:flagellar basal body P-ring protein FlgI [Oryzomicrobium sp.]|uniref:flagellar basal body P-ring protein FlgI n=1 Tax=Oryzomicrobium sp. TaxID=1911578 RepID=UPI0025D5D4C1|nr:flagellar basal body P-ring protein FlgI [Oryzomicrobium sp.]MCE1241875.1 flagellar basal body P-ring protein FlgI [Oryzomicrobium sp.]
MRGPRRFVRRFAAVSRISFLALAVFAAAAPAHAERIKDLATVQGVRNNQLLGYGLVVGLDGSGDQTTQTPFTVQSLTNLLSQLGVNLPTTGQPPQLRNVAAVMVTANLPPYAKAGQQIDVTVSSMGNAKSLRGGTLLMTPLKGADGQVYAMAQGSLAVGGVGASASGSSAQINHLSAGRIPAGATVEREVPSAVGQGGYIHYELNTADFDTARRIVDAINREVGPVAQAVDGRQIRVSAPDDPNARIAFLGRIENLDVKPAMLPAKVIVNSRTGSVVMNQTVRIDPCAVAHGNLSVVIGTQNSVSQPNAFSQGQTAGVSNSDVQIKQDGTALINLKGGANLADVVKALNTLGAKPQDMLAILQAMKVAGALRAELEII